MRINHNITALNTYRQLSSNGTQSSKNLEKLSSGLRINRAGDDAAGLAISEKMRGQIRGLDQATRNSQDAISMMQTAEGALNETHSILQRMKELATQAANDTYNSNDRTEIQKEINQLTSEINRIGNTTEFNTRKLLNGEVSAQSGVVTAGTLTAGTTTLDNLTLDKKSALTAGNYSIVVADSTAASATHTATADITDVSIDAASTLAAGNYQVTIAGADTKAASLTTTADAITAATITPNSVVADGAHTVNITRTDSVATFTAATTGFTNDTVAVTAQGVTGTYTVETSGVAEAATAGTAHATAAGAFAVNIVDPAALDGAVGYRLAYVQESATPGNEIWSVELQDNTGASISDRIILDDNVQNYDFKLAGVDIGVSVTTTAGVNATLQAQDVANNGNYSEFNVNTLVSLDDGVNPADTATLLATAGAGSFAIGDFTIDHTGGDSLTAGGSDTFTVTNTLSATFNGLDAQVTTAPGADLTFANGVTVTTSNDISLYDTGGVGEDYTVTVGTVETYTATVEDSLGGAVAGSQTVSVDGTTGGTYNLGNGVEFTLAAGATVSGGVDHDFTVAVGTVSTATLTNTTTATTAGTADVTGGATTADFGNGLTVDIAATTAGTATFAISGGVEDNSLTMQVGANQGQGFKVSVNDMRSEALGISSSSAGAALGAVGAAWTSAQDVSNGTDNSANEYGLDVSDTVKASAAIKVYDDAINQVSTERSRLGAFQNRLEHTINNLGTSSENLTAAESRIRDVDMAREMMEFTKNNILTQAAQSMLAQANQQPQGVLQLLR